MPSPVPLGPSSATGADVYLSVRTKRGGEVKGEAHAAGHENAIQLHGFQFGLTSGAAVGSVQATGRRHYQNLVVVKRLDSSTTSLMSALATNDEVKELKLTMRKPGGGQDDFFSITLSAARITNLVLDCDADGNAQEHVSIAFAKVDMTYRIQGKDGVMGAASTFTDEVLTPG